jgi:hypothetical protein
VDGDSPRLRRTPAGARRIWLGTPREHSAVDRAGHPDRRPYRNETAGPDITQRRGAAGRTRKAAVSRTGIAATGASDPTDNGGEASRRRSCGKVPFESGKQRSADVASQIYPQEGRSWEPSPRSGGQRCRARSDPITELGLAISSAGPSSARHGRGRSPGASSSTGSTPHSVARRPSKHGSTGMGKWAGDRPRRHPRGIRCWESGDRPYSGDRRRSPPAAAGPGRQQAFDRSRSGAGQGCRLPIRTFNLKAPRSTRGPGFGRSAAPCAGRCTAPGRRPAAAPRGPPTHPSPRAAGRGGPSRARPPNRSGLWLARTSARASTEQLYGACRGDVVSSPALPFRGGVPAGRPGAESTSCPDDRRPGLGTAVHGGAV